MAAAIGPIPVAEFVAVAALRQKLSQAERRIARRHRWFGGEVRRFAIEAQHVPQHAQEGRPQQIAALGKQGVEIAARPLDGR